MNEEKRVYDLIIRRQQSGYADDAMNAARAAGCRGRNADSCRHAQQPQGGTADRHYVAAGNGNFNDFDQARGQAAHYARDTGNGGLKNGRGRRFVFPARG